MEKEILITAALSALTMVAFAGWWLMVRQPQQWASWVDRENDFWRGKGLITTALAEKLKRWEKGRAIKLLAAVTTFIGAIGLSLTLAVLVKAVSLQHQKLRMPYNPALLSKPPKQPVSKPR